MLTPSSVRIARGIVLAALLPTSSAAFADDAPEAPEAPTAEEEPPPPLDQEDDQSSLPRTIAATELEPRGVFPAAPPEGPSRVLIGSLSLGPGWLALRDKVGRDGQAAVSLTARVGAVVAPEWCVFLGVDHSSTERGGATFAQTAGLLGVERYFFGRLYLGGALAVAQVRESGVPDGLTDGPGWGLSALLGVEVRRSRHVAITTELAVTAATYGDEAWEMGGLRIGVALY